MKTKCEIGGKRNKFQAMFQATGKVLKVLVLVLVTVAEEKREKEDIKRKWTKVDRFENYLGNKIKRIW